jgi:F0F1-type ATP synthase assembly protein I
MARRSLKKNSKEAGSRERIIKELGPYLNLGMQLVVTIALMALLGWWLDSKLDTEPWLMVILSFFGAVAGMVNFIRTALESTKKQKKGDHQDV